MKDPRQASMPLYIRFGEIPKDENSAVHRSDEIIRNEGGVSVWRAIEDQGRYWPLLPDCPNDNTVADYFSMLLNRYDSDKRVYLVTGKELCIEGACREPLLFDVKVLEDITHYYCNRNQKKKLKERESIENNILKELKSLGLLSEPALREYKKFRENKKEPKEGEDATD